MDDAEYEQFLDLIYEASIRQEDWIGVIERLTDLVGGSGGFISRLNVRDGGGAMEVAGYDPGIVGQYFAHYAATNPLTIVADSHAYFREWRPRILLDEELMEKSELVAGEFYNDFMRPNDTHSCMMIRLAAAGESVFAITVGRSLRCGPFTEADRSTVRRLHPHLVRSFAVCQELTAARSACEQTDVMLENSRLGIVMIDGEGKVRRMNRAAEGLISEKNGLRMNGARLSTPSLGDTDRLHRLIDDAAAPEAERRRGGDMILASSDRRLPLSVTIIPMQAEQGKVFGGETSVMMTITDPLADAGISEQRLANVLGLTAAERRVATALFAGKTPKEIAASLGLSFFTIRGHLVRIYEKTGVSRQADLIRVMTRLADTG